MGCVSRCLQQECAVAITAQDTPALPHRPHCPPSHTCERMMRPMPKSICSVDTLCVELPSPDMMDERPTMAMPACGGGGCWWVLCGHMRC